MQVAALVAYLRFAKGRVTWEDAFRGIETVGGDSYSVSRSQLHPAREDFASVLHFWGVVHTEYGNKFPTDFPAFAGQSALVLALMREKEACGALRGDVFTSPKIRVPWEKTGEVGFRLRRGTLSPKIAPNSQKAPRPQAPELGVYFSRQTIIRAFGLSTHRTPRGRFAREHMAKKLLVGGVIEGAVFF